MIINKSYKYRLYLTKKQKANFQSLYEKCVYLFNLLLKIKKTLVDNQDDEGIYIKDLVKKYKFFDNGNFLAYISTYHLGNQILKKYKEGYINEYPKDKNVEKYPKKIHFDIKTSYKLNDTKNRIFLDKIGNFKIKYHRDLPTNAYIRNIIIEEKTIGEFYLNLGVSEFLNKEEIILKTAVGLDYSSPHLFISSNNESGEQFLVRNYLSKKINKIKRRMQNCVYQSKNYQKLKNKHEKLNEKVSNKRNYNLHHCANDLLNKYDLIGVETLSLIKIAQHLHLGKNTYQNAYNKLLKILEYKSIIRSKKLIKIPMFYPSSKICSNCGQIMENLTLDKRVFTCLCGFKIDRDLNAAINIKEKALSIYSKEHLKRKSYKNDNSKRNVEKE